MPPIAVKFSWAQLFSLHLKLQLLLSGGKELTFFRAFIFFDRKRSLISFRPLDLGTIVLIPAFKTLFEFLLARVLPRLVENLAQLDGVRKPREAVAGDVAGGLGPPLTLEEPAEFDGTPW